MMTIKFLTRSASPRGNFEPGDTANMPDDVAELLVKAGSAEKVEAKTEPKPKKETVEKKAVTEPDEKATMPPPKRRRSNKES